MMHTLKRIFDFYIFANIHVAVATFCLTKITLLKYEIKADLVPFFIFFATVTSYNFIRLFRTSETQHWFFYFIKEYKRKILILTGTSTLIMTYLIFLIELKTLFVLAPLGLFTLLYAVPVGMGKLQMFSLRGIAMLKLFLIAFTWAGVTVLVPLINYEVPIGRNELIIFVQRFLFIIVITIPFDIRDLKYDPENLKTLPQVFGIRKVKMIGLFFLMLFFGLEFLKESLDPGNLRVNLFIGVSALLLLVKGSENQHKYYSAFLVESIPILWLIVYLVLK